MSSEVEICNSALIKLSTARINSLDDDSKQARLCKTQYPIIRDKLLQSHPWNFAIKRVELAPDATAPLYGYTYAYSLPSDYLRVLSVEEQDEGGISNAKYVIEGKKVLTDLQPFKMRYLYRVTNTDTFTAAFREILALDLAIDLSYTLLQSNQLVQRLEQQKQEALRDVRSYDAQEGTPRELTENIFLNARI